jgi:acyl carrier protein
MTDVQTRLAKCFTAVFPHLRPSEVSSATIESVEGWDSLATVTLLTVVEEEFGTTIEPEELEHLRSFEAYVRRLSADSTSVAAIASRALAADRRPVT